MRIVFHGEYEPGGARKVLGDLMCPGDDVAREFVVPDGAMWLQVFPTTVATEGAADVGAPMDDRMIRLVNGSGAYVATWKLGEFPDWLAVHLDTLPNESAVFRYRIEHDGKRYDVQPGPLAVEVYHVLLKRDLA